VRGVAAILGCDHAQVKNRLYDEFRIEVPIIYWDGKPFIRISIQVYNSREDVDRLLDALSSLFKF